MDTNLETKIQAVDLKKQAAERTGLETGRFHTVQIELDILRQQGLLIDLNISGTSMFNKTASFAEMGIAEEEDDIRSSRFAHATKYLIPDDQIKRLRSIEARMRQTLDGLSFNVNGFKPYRWLPFTAYDAFVEKFAKLQAELNSVKAEIMSNYDSYVDLLAKDFAQVAENSWKSITAQGYEWVILVVNGKRIPHDHDMFIDYVVGRALAKMPSLSAIEDNLQADYVPALLYGQQDIEADKAKAELLKAETFKVNQEAYLASAEKEEKVRHKMKMNQLKEDEKASKILAIQRAEADHARKQLSAIASPFEEVFTSLRSHMAQSCLEIRDSVMKSGFVRGKVAERGKGLLDFFRLMAIHDDRELLVALQELDGLLGSVGKDRGKDAPDRDADKIVQALNDVITLAETAKEDLLSGPNRFDFIEF